ncbi:hypothetical protein QJS10_CPA10g00847 [Acorus calamus]|uniref:DUF641 domain-containing protein n=1 Tax=Acorus calamus TaxID=4465 RepID=A0AAV9DZS3_ACOCL|nr:hypothetical protein QJS10_CPA10g00847 [Acorus calamus]
MLQKFALAFKTKTIEFFAEDEEEEEDGRDPSHIDGLSSAAAAAAAEEVITGQRVVVIKPDDPPRPKIDHETLVSSLFAATSSFRAAYVQLQASHSPFDAAAVSAADRAAVSHLHRLSDLKRYHRNPSPDCPLLRHAEAQVEENQSLLRAFETIANRLQSDIDAKDTEASDLRRRLEEIETSISASMGRLGRSSVSASGEDGGVRISLGLFDSAVRDARRSARKLTRALTGRMRLAGWDLDSAAESVHGGVAYAKRSHVQYAFLSYVCLGMFGGFDSESFGESDGCGGDPKSRKNRFLRRFIEHATVDPSELLMRRPECEFARYCERKYEQVVRPIVGSYDVDRTEEGLGEDSVHDMFVELASSVWMVHKLAYSFDLAVEIFRVERGAGFSAVYMENVVRSASDGGGGGGGSGRRRVGFTVAPGFRVGGTVIQCQVYLERQ